MSKKNQLAKGFALPLVNQNTAIDEVAAKEFEKETPKKIRRKRKSSLRSDARGERLAVYIPEELASDLRVLCAKERRSLSDAVTVALEAWLKRRKS